MHATPVNQQYKALARFNWVVVPRRSAGCAGAPQRFPGGPHSAAQQRTAPRGAPQMEEERRKMDAGHERTLYKVAQHNGEEVRPVFRKKGRQVVGWHRVVGRCGKLQARMMLGSCQPDQKPAGPMRTQSQILTATRYVAQDTREIYQLRRPGTWRVSKYFLMPRPSGRNTGWRSPCIDIRYCSQWLQEGRHRLQCHTMHPHC